MLGSGRGEFIRDLAFGLAFFGETAQFAFGENALAVQIDLEDAATRGDQLDAREFGLVLVQYFRSQGDRPGQVASAGSVFDAHSHLGMLLSSCRSAAIPGGDDRTPPGMAALRFTPRPRSPVVGGPPRADGGCGAAVP